MERNNGALINQLCLISSFLLTAYGITPSIGNPALTVEKPTPSTVVLPTNDALLYPERGGIALRYEVNFFRELPSMLYFSDLWISLRPAGGDDRGVFHFVYKGTQPPGRNDHDQRLISKPVDAGILTFFINYTDGVYTFYVNGDPVAGSIRIPFALLGNSIRTFSRGVPGGIATLSAALSAEPFTEAQMRSLSQPETEWKMQPQMTLLVPKVKGSEDESACEGILGNAIIPAEEYQEFVSRPRQSIVIYVDRDHPNASDENSGVDASLPMKTISAALGRAQPNTTVWIRKGVYPESVDVHRGGLGIQSPITISGWPGEEDQVILTGADRVTGWEPYGENLWRRKNWDVQWGDWGAGDPGWESGEPPFDPVKRWRRSWREHIFLEGQELMHMESFAALIPMSFTVDKERGICYLKLADGLNPDEKNLEAPRRSTGIKVNSDNIVVRGLVIEKFTESGLSSRGQHCRFENIVTRYNYDGVDMSGSNNIYRGIRAIYNGRTGMTGGPTDCIVTDSLLLCNNTKGITQSFHAGGMKLCSARDVTIRRVNASYNRGVGIWFDIFNKHIIVEDCTAVGNANTGIFIEISDGPCLIRNNFCMNNSTGIVIAESDDCTVVHNTCVYNQRGFAMRYGDRPRMHQSGYVDGKLVERGPIGRKEPQGAFTVKNLVLSNNIFAYNTQVQLDGRNWRRDTWRDAVKNNYQSDYNLLWAGSPDAALIGWETGMINKLEDWPLRDLWETHSVVAEPGFEGRGPYDFALSPDSPASKMGNMTPACPVDRYGRRWMLPAAGAVEPILHEVWSSRTLEGQGETNAWPDPD